MAFLGTTHSRPGISEPWVLTFVFLIKWALLNHTPYRRLQQLLRDKWGPQIAWIVMNALEYLWVVTFTVFTYLCFIYGVDDSVDT